MQNVLVDGVSTFHLQVEEGEATSPTDICLRQRQFLWRGFGLVAGLVMLLGASSLPIYSLAAPADAPSGSTNTAAFIHANRKSPQVPAVPLSYLPAVPRLRQGRHDSRMPPPRVQPTPLKDMIFFSDSEIFNRDVTGLNVTGLKQLLKERGLSVSGNKAELITRLEAYEDAVMMLTVPELKVMLKEKGLPVSGKKAELITRLVISTEPQIGLLSLKTRTRVAKFKEGISKLTVPELKHMLQENGLPIAGKKEELINKLEADYSTGLWRQTWRQRRKQTWSKSKGSRLFTISSIRD